MPTVLASACVGQHITRHHGQADCVVEFAIGEQPGIEVTTEPRNWSIRRRSKSSRTASDSDSPVGFNAAPAHREATARIVLTTNGQIAASVSNAIATTCDAIRKELLRLAKKMPDSPLADAKVEVTLAEGMIVSKEDASRAVSIADAMRQGAVDRIEQEKSADSNDDGKYARNTHSAIFAEVKVDEQLGIIRVARIVNAVAAGRILNTKTARNQIMGGVVWGIGMALHEETLVDHNFGRIVNANFAEYHVPVNADVHDVEVIFVDEPDDIINPLGIKGVGEIGIVGTAAAIANAIHHATGKRVRDLPVTLDKLQR
jgi:xanthine dehydrogenase YagR molybdenum-binding subunit